MDRALLGIAVDKTGWWRLFEKTAQELGLLSEVFEIERSDWIERVSRYGYVLWRPNLDPPFGDEAKEKIFFLESHLGLRVFPNWSTFWHYDNKRAQAYFFRRYRVPSPETFVSFLEEDARAYLESRALPLVSKRAGGASSDEVRSLADRRAAHRELKRAFSRPLITRALTRQGITLRMSTRSQSGYVLWQEMVPGNRRDLRVTVIGGRYAFAYYRNNRPGDFRASGSGLIDYDVPTPTREMCYCIGLCREHDFDSMAFDIVYRGDEFLILEMSYAFVDRFIHNVPGYYTLDGGRLEFHVGHVWPQALVVRHVRDRMIADGAIPG